MSGRWGAFYIRKIRSGEAGVLLACSEATGARAALVCSQQPPIVTALEAITRRESPKGQTYIVAMAMSLSERLSLVDFGAAGNSISNLGSFDMVPACLGEKKCFCKGLLSPSDVSAPPTSDHWGHTCTVASTPFQGSQGLVLGLILGGDGMVWGAL